MIIIDKCSITGLIKEEPKWWLDYHIRKYAYDMFKHRLDTMYYPDFYVLPLTPEGESYREYLLSEEYIDKRISKPSILRYGIEEYNFKYKGEMYLAILVNND